VLERVRKEDNVYQRIEIRHYVNEIKGEEKYSIECEEGFLNPHRVLSQTRLRNLTNMLISSPSENPSDERKINLLTKGYGRFTLLELDVNLRSVIFSGVDKRQDEDKKTVKHKRRKFVEL